MDKYERLEQIGWKENNRPIQYKYRHMEIGNVVAVKTLIMQSSDDFGVPCMTLRKISLPKEIEHQNVARLMGSFDSYTTDPRGENGPRPGPGPASEDQETTFRISQNLEKIIPDFKPAGTDILSRMLCPNPSRRITVEEALEHSYFKLGVRYANP